jgi:N-acetylglucosaminyldiphosphoundecaprenol N-acetyl-beta-D-mannosaminyltransferase
MRNLETKSFRLLGVPIAATSMTSAIETVSSWVVRGARSKMVTFTTVHMLVEAARSPAFSAILEESDLNCPDGMPLVWCGRSKGESSIRRVCGPDFLPTFCKTTVDLKLRHFFYGGAEGVAENAVEHLLREIPELQVAGVYTPPFRSLTSDEDEDIVKFINSTAPDVIWVCLGCPKQEIWIFEHKNRLSAGVMLAVGLALDIVAGSRRRAPGMLRVVGLEWFYRLCQEPGRLWKRYLVYNSIFLYRLLIETLTQSGRELEL